MKKEGNRKKEIREETILPLKGGAKFKVVNGNRHLRGFDEYKQMEREWTEEKAKDWITVV